MANAFLKPIGGTSSITSGPSRNINQAVNKVNFGQSPNSIEHATGKATAAGRQRVTTLLLFKSSRAAPGDAILSANKHIKPMKTTNHYAKIALLSLAAIFTAMSARGDTYSWTNFQSDIHGVAQHTDSNLVNPWGLAAGATGTIWVSDNGTGVSTLYNQDGTVVPLV